LPIKSWSFTHLGHPMRAEIWWRFTGLNRKVLYLDHRRVVGQRGRFTVGRPMVAEVDGPDGTKQKISVRFRPRWNPIEMVCELSTGDGPPTPVPTSRVYKRKLHQPESGESENVFLNKLGCLLLLGFMLIMCVLYAPLMMAGGIIHDWQERRLRNRLRKRGRYLSWPNLEQRLLKSPGTLILQLANLTPMRIWWTEADVLTETPLPLPHEMQALSPGREDHPFFEWCHAKYLDEQSGTAMWVDLPRGEAKKLGLFQNRSDPKRLHDRYPGLNVVITGYTHGKREAAAQRFQRIIGDDIHAALPGLIAGTSDDDPAIRELCREAIQYSGEIAAAAVPALKQELFLATKGETYSIAKTLAALGPAGIGILKEAESCGDPDIARSARSALSMRKINKEVGGITSKRPPLDPAVEKARERKRRRDLWLTIGISCLVVSAVVVSAWFFGTLITLGGTVLCFISFVCVSIGIILRRTQKARTEIKWADRP
jgi:hypothetical protein